jgi:hypothetical protein
MALTAAAMIAGAGVNLFDPIFQGLAISLMAGEVASLLLSRMAVPVLYYMANRHERTEPAPAVAVTAYGTAPSMPDCKKPHDPSGRLAA